MSPRCEHKSIARIKYENRVEYSCLQCSAKFVPKRELAAAQSELERVRAENARLMAKIEHDRDCAAYPRIGELSIHEERCNCSRRQEPTK